MFFLGFWVPSALHIYAIPIRSEEKIPDYLITNGFIEDAEYYEVIHFADIGIVLLVFHVVYGLYMAFVFCYIGYMTVAHMIMVWYLDKDEAPYKTCCCCCCCCLKPTKSSRDAAGIVILSESIGTVLKYHIGSASFYAMTSSIGYPDICRGFARFCHWAIPRTKDIHNARDCCEAVCDCSRAIETEG